MSPCNEMICQHVTLSGYAERPKVADAVIEALCPTKNHPTFTSLACGPEPRVAISPLFRINADNRQLCYRKNLSLRGDVLKLLIPLRILRPHLLPLIGLEGEVHSQEKVGFCSSINLRPPPSRRIRYCSFTRIDRRKGWGSGSVLEKAISLWSNSCNS